MCYVSVRIEAFAYEPAISLSGNQPQPPAAQYGGGHLPLHRPGHPGVRRHQGVQRPAGGGPYVPGLRGHPAGQQPPGADHPLPPGRGAGAVYAAADSHAVRAGGRGPVVRLFPGKRGRHAGCPGEGLRPAGSCPQGRDHGGPGGPAGGLLGPGRDAGRVRPCGAGPAPCGTGRRRREPGVLRLHPAHAGESGPAGTYRPAGGGCHRPEAGDRVRRSHQLLHPGPLGHHAGRHQPPAHRRGYLSGQGFTGGLGHPRHGLSADGLHDPAGPDRGGEGQAYPPGGSHYGGLLLQPAHL